MKLVALLTALSMPMMASAAFDSAQAPSGKVLKILRITPTGEDVPPARQIVIEFDRPVVPVGPMARDPVEIPIAKPQARLPVALAQHRLAGPRRGLPFTGRLGDPSARSERRVYSPEVSWLIADILADPQARTLEFGDGGLLRFPVETAIKTGTSSDYRDAWAAGFNHRYAVGVWMGNPHPRAQGAAEQATRHIK